MAGSLPQALHTLPLENSDAMGRTDAQDRRGFGAPAQWAQAQDNWQQKETGWRANERARQLKDKETGEKGD